MKKSQFERLLDKDFSPDVKDAFGKLQKHLTIQTQEKPSGSKNKSKNETKGVLLRGVVRGLSLKQKIEKNKNGGSRNGVSLLPILSRERKNLHSFRLPSPSVVALKNNLPYQNLKRIKGKHLLILKLDMEGRYSRADIAGIVGCSEPTVTNTLNSPAIQEMKGRAFQNIEDDYSALLRPAVAAIRLGLHSGDLELKVKTAFSYLKSKGRGLKEVHHKHEHAHKHSGEVEVSAMKAKLLQKVGLDPIDVVEAEFSEAK